jgi:arsenate reductase
VDAVTIYHNGQCSKSGDALELLIAHNIPHHVRFYIAEPLSEEELRALLKKLELKAEDIVRKNEPLFTEQFSGKELNEDDWLQVLLQYPELMQRPVIELADKAFIARPPEKVLELLK